MTLFDQVATFRSLRSAAVRAARGHRRRADVAGFLADLERGVLAIERELRDGTWRPGPLTTFAIRDPKPRMIAAAPFRDCVVHHAICAAMEPFLEAVADPDSFACRVGKGNHAAVARVRELAARNPWFVGVDIRHYFECVPHRLLKERLAEALPDRSLEPLVAAILDVGATHPGVGLPIGALTSQHFANLYLGGLDRFARTELRVGGWVRYMDDMVAFGPDRATVKGWARALGVAATSAGLALKDEVTVIAPCRVGVPVLGFRVWPNLVRLDSARARRFRRHVRAAERLPEAERDQAVASLIAWVSHAHTRSFRRSFFARLGLHRAEPDAMLLPGAQALPAPTA